MALIVRADRPQGIPEGGIGPFLVPLWRKDDGRSGSGGVELV